MHLLSPLSIAVTIVLVLVGFSYSGPWAKSRFPGPPKKWLIGNLLDLPKMSDEQWLRFTEWKEHYGNIVYAEALGTSIIVLNNLGCILEFLDKRGGIYSNRPIFTMAGELFGMNRSMPLGSYGEEWKRQRRLAHKALSKDAVRKYDHVQGEARAQFLHSLLEDSGNFGDQLYLAAQRIVVTITYGITVHSRNDEYITEAEAVMKMITDAIVPGQYLVDFITWLKYLPRWVPGTKFLQDGQVARERILSFVNRPFQLVHDQINSGALERASLTADLLENIEEFETQESTRTELLESIKWATGSLYGAGAETTYSTVQTFILLMALHPEVQARAQREIDVVIGTADRLPTLNDEQSLPFVSAIIKEVMRWRPALPLSIARRNSTEDIFEGCFIPRDSIVIPNVWAITRDSSEYPEPEKFLPDRFLQSGKQPLDPMTYVFGFGRRICPGKHLAQNSVFLLISGILYTMNISQKLDSTGKKIAICPQFATGAVSYPKPFECDIVPRSSKMRNLINASLLTYTNN